MYHQTNNNFDNESTQIPKPSKFKRQVNLMVMNEVNLFSKSKGSLFSSVLALKRAGFWREHQDFIDGPSL